MKKAVFVVILLVLIGAVAYFFFGRASEQIPTGLLGPTQASLPPDFKLVVPDVYSDGKGYTFTYMDNNTDRLTQISNPHDEITFIEYTGANNPVSSHLSKYADAVANVENAKPIDPSIRPLVVQHFTYQNSPGIVVTDPNSFNNATPDVSNLVELYWNDNGYNMQITVSQHFGGIKYSPQDVIRLLSTLKRY